MFSVTIFTLLLLLLLLSLQLLPSLLLGAEAQSSRSYEDESRGHAEVSRRSHCWRWHSDTDLALLATRISWAGMKNTCDRARCHPMLHTKESTLRCRGTCSVLPGS